ncbi:MAG: glycosyltransferase family 9 protein [Deltaproteobacteria bacterium]|nr:glycosyltransferase family 9 protein [Deltaproteobacteria bacterium]
MFIKSDCRYFIGEKPCKFNQLCEGCGFYEPMGKRILIVKLGATGDVLRTTPILKPLKVKHNPSHITWLIDKNSAAVLNGNPFIDKLLIFDAESLAGLMVEQFDVVINFDKAYKATAIAEMVKGKKKYGFGLNRYGTIYPLNDGSNYALSLGLSDELKFRKNKKTYQELLFESVCMDYHKEEYVFNIAKDDVLWSENYLKSQGGAEGNLLIGLNTGGGDIFANKGWHENGFLELAELCAKNLNAKVILLGGPQEVEKNERLCRLSKIPLINSGNNTLGRFAGIVKHCDIVISGDTLAMHIAIAVKTPVVALFFSTCPQEIEFYGRGMVVSTNTDCAPCYKRSCAKDDCLRDVSVEKVYQGITSLLAKHKNIEKIGSIYKSLE